MTKWEYKIILLTKMTKTLTDMGADGWELVTIVPDNRPEHYKYYFKRPLEDNKE